MVKDRRRHLKNTSGLKQILAKAICVTLIVSILTVSAPAAPAVVIGTAGEIAQDIRYGFYSSNWAIDFPAVFGLFVKSKGATQNEQISRVQIFPGSVTIKKGEEIIFSAVAYDSENEPMSGVAFDWRMTDSEHRFPPRKFHGGRFKANIVGTFTVRAKSNGRQAEVTVIVTPSPLQAMTQTTQNRTASVEISSRSNKSTDQIEPEAVSNGTAEQNINAVSPDLEPSLPDNGGWNNDNWQSADDPGNQTGNPPGTPADDGAGSGNFQLSASVISLPGRGIDLALNLNYNSRLWNKSLTQPNSTQLTYDIDRGFPAPGWSLGFGKIVDFGVNGGSMLVDADGTRHSFSGSISQHPSFPNYFNFYGHTTDGKFIDYRSDHDPNGIFSAIARMPNGTIISYGAKGSGAVYPVSIQDANGNYITITYRNHVGPNIETVTDTMGRIINFNYDTNGRLISVTAPRMRDQGTIYGLSRTRTLVRFHYRPLPLNYWFAPGISAVAPSSPPYVLDAI